MLELGLTFMQRPITEPSESNLKRFARIGQTLMHTIMSELFKTIGSGQEVSCKNVKIQVGVTYFATEREEFPGECLICFHEKQKRHKI